MLSNLKYATYFSILICLHTVPGLCIEIMGEEGHPVDHKHDYDHNQTEHGHARDHANHNDPVKYFSQLDNIKGHEIHHLDFVITKPAYDIRDRPRGKNVRSPVQVTVSAAPRYLSTIDDIEQEVVIGMVLTTRWKDKRIRDLTDIKKDLLYPDRHKDAVDFPGKIAEEIWTPDIYIETAQGASIPAINEAADTITIKRNSLVEQSTFFVISFKCDMDFANYPLDEQLCNLDLTSFAHNTKNMKFKWSKSKPFGGRVKYITTQFHVEIFRPKENAFTTSSLQSVLRISVHLKRHLVFHIYMMYLPSAMLVLVGWLSLLVPLDFSYGRIMLCVFSLLMLVAMFITLGRKWPGTKQLRASDVWMFICISFVLWATTNCIIDLRCISVVEKESQLAAEEEYFQQADAMMANEPAGKTATPAATATTAETAAPSAPSHPAQSTLPPSPYRAMAIASPPGYGARQAGQAGPILPRISVYPKMPTVRPVLPPIVRAPGNLPPVKQPRMSLTAGMPLGKIAAARSATWPTLKPPAPHPAPNVAPRPTEPRKDIEPKKNPTAPGDKHKRFRRDRPPLVATPVVLRWLRLSLCLERTVTLLYPTLYVLAVAGYWGYYLGRNKIDYTKAD